MCTWKTEPIGHQENVAQNHVHVHSHRVSLKVTAPLSSGCCFQVKFQPCGFQSLFCQCLALHTSILAP